MGTINRVIVCKRCNLYLYTVHRLGKIREYCRPCYRQHTLERIRENARKRKKTALCK